MSAGDTIVALATPPGRGALSVLRVSGPRAQECIVALTARKSLRPRRATLCTLRDAGGQAVDQGIAVFYPAPKSATGEDVLELTCHGAPVAVAALLAHIQTLGARPAQPGEFSRRAFAAGKLDLAQAQAVADLVAATTERAGRCAARVLRGAVSQEVQALCTELVDLLVPIEGLLDFPDEEVGAEDASAHARIRAVRDRLDLLLRRARQGRAVHTGARLALLGAPNAGKSSLLNHFTGEDRAIVTDEPGTTRDVLSAALQINGVALQLQDTAGIRDARAAAETEGVARSWRCAEEADIVLHVFDAAAGWSDADAAIAGRLRDRARLTLANKRDLLGAGAPPRGGPTDALAVSAKTGAGIDALRARVVETLQLDTALEEGEFMAHSRQLDALRRAHAAAARAAATAEQEIIAEELRTARAALGELVGEFSSEDLLGEIFARFCIGK